MSSAGPIFVVGYPRSGTTLLTACLGQHSRIVMAQEPELVLGLRRLGVYPGSRLSADQVRELACRLTAPGILEHLEPPEKKAVVDGVRNAGRPLSFQEIYEALLPTPQDGRVWGEKSLNNLFYALDLIQMYPDALVVHIRRDVRAVSRSKFEKQFRDGGQPIVVDRDRILYFANQSRRWRTWVEHAHRARQQAPARNWMEIPYEAFVANPRLYLAAVCERLGLSFESGMLDPEARRQSSIVTGKYGFAHTRVGQEIDPIRARSFADLPEELLWVIERSAEPVLSRLGYAPIARRPSGLSGVRLSATLLLNSVHLRRDLRRHLRKRLR